MHDGLINPPELMAVARDGLGVPTARPAHVVMLGAGMAGLVAAYELKRAGHRVTLLEARHRSGGRIYTLRDPFSQGQYSEAGAMRIPTKHRLVTTYIDRFGLKLKPFTSSNPNAWAYFHRKRGRLGETMAQSHKLGFALSAAERNTPFTELWARSIRPFLDEIESGDAAAWASLQRRLQSISLRDHLLAEGWSEGAIEMYGLFVGFETLLYASAFEFIREFVTDLRNSTVTIDGGMDQLTGALAQELEGCIQYGSAVTALDQSDAGVEVHVRGLSGTRVVRGDYAICTIPLSVLRHIEVEKPFSWAKQRAIRNIHYEAATKIFFECNERFWETQEGIYGGASVTDLAIRNIYYPEHGRQTGRGVLIGSYSHGQDAHRWGALAPHDRLSQAMENIQEIHPRFGDHAEAGASVVWNQDEFAGGAYAFFQPHQEAQLHDAICEPEGRYYFAGEHASLQHRWVQGAVESAIRVAKAIHSRTTQETLNVTSHIEPEHSFQDRLITDLEQRQSYANDFGGVHRHVPAAVVRPRSTQDVVEAVVYARSKGLKIAARGVGHSAGGQSQVPDGLVLDMTALDQIHWIDTKKGCFLADAGVRWRTLMETLVPLGYTPPVVTDWLHLTLGGTIVAGGVGAQSFKHGIQAGLIEEMTVVTGDGQVLTCSATQNTDLFDATRAGLGQYGIIMQAQMRIQPAPERVTLDHFVYDNLTTFISDVERLMACDAVDGLLAHAVGNTLPLIGHSTGVNYAERGLDESPATGRWLMDLEVFRFHREGHAGGLPDGLAPIQALSDRSEWSFADVIERVPPIVERDARQGAAPHPELALFLPHSQAASFIGEIMEETPIDDMGGGPVLIIPMSSAAIDAPFFRVPDESRCWLFGLLRAADTPEKLKRLTEKNLEIYERATRIGACRYPCDGVPAPSSTEGWAKHFGPVWERALAAKERYDPDHLFSPMLGIFSK
ncbi:MAG: monoamine oxidase [Myxococcota bacterium]|jgi:monoamine oxidase